MDPTHAAERWHGWAATSTPEQIVRFLAHLDSHLPAGWQRLREAEEALRQTMDPGSNRWYAFSSPTPSGPTVGLMHPHAAEVRGGRVFLGGPVLPPPADAVNAAWTEVMTFLDNGIQPAVHAAGVDFHPSSQFVAELPWDTRDRLQQFSDASRKSLPLQPPEAERWREFVVSAYRTRTPINARLFGNWLVSQGWAREAAAELTLRFFDQSLLLSRYTEEAAA